MPQLPIESLALVVDRLTALAHDDQQLRNDLRALARYVLEVTDRAADAAAVAPAVEILAALPAALETAASAAALSTAILPAQEVPPPEPLPALTLGQPRPQRLQAGT
ncbi:MAG: hypothetical protein WD872_11515 [Pirellulaceae bacterium]